MPTITNLLWLLVDANYCSRSHRQGLSLITTLHTCLYNILWFFIRSLTRYNTVQKTL